jgi:hypothetical protein
MVAGALGRGETDECFGASERVVEPPGVGRDRIAFGLRDERRAADVGDAVGQAVVDADAQSVGCWHGGEDASHTARRVVAALSCSPDVSVREEYPMSQAFNRKAAYRWYLGHEFWREKCEYVFKRANGKCEKCGKRPPTEVHHLTYIRVFQELPSDLLAVCRQCHAEINWRQPANDNQIQLVFDFPTPEAD